MRYPALGVVRPAPGGNGHRATSISGSNQGHGIDSNGRQFNYDNHDQEVNDTNIDPVSPFGTGRLEEG